MSEPQGLFSGSTGQQPYAGFWWRFLAFLIDHSIKHTMGFLMGLGFCLVCEIVVLFTGDNQMITEMTILILFLVTCGLALVLDWFYFACQESSEWQATLGKRVCGLKVTDAEGHRISFGKASGRYWGKWLSTLTCLIGYIMAAFTQKRQALHDIIAGTLVIKP